MLPVQNVIPTRTQPRVVLALITALAAVFAAELAASPDRLREIIYAYGVVPASLTWYAPVTALLLHHGWIQAGTSALALWIFGPGVEDRLGPWRFLLLALTAGAAGSLTETWFRGTSPLPVIGGAGLVAAVIAVHFVLFPRSKTLVLTPSAALVDAIEVPSALLVAFWLLLQVIGSHGRLTASLATGGLTPFAPIGGALAGLLLFVLVRRPDRERVEWWGN